MRTLYCDEDLIVVDKPSGLLSVPGRLPENKDSVLTRLNASTPAFAVHRLDMPTSGVMVVARNKEALKNLNAQFAERRVYKQYIAVVEGIVEQDSIEVDARISCDWPNRPRQHISDDGKPSKTKLDVISRDIALNCSLLKLKPTTGRSHQLRVHMQYIGHPILGCEFYAPFEVRNRSTRLLLHAESITFTHPTHRSLCHFYSQSTEIAEFFHQIGSPTSPDVSTGPTTATATTPSTTKASVAKAAARYP